jgi:hypothetical protein
LIGQVRAIGKGVAIIVAGVLVLQIDIAGEGLTATSPRGVEILIAKTTGTNVRLTKTHSINITLALTRVLAQWITQGTRDRLTSTCARSRIVEVTILARTLIRDVRIVSAAVISTIA